MAFYRDKVKVMMNSEILSLIKNVFVPDELYTFPKSNGRSFCINWLKSHRWLCYSPSVDGGFCLPGILFGGRFAAKLKKKIKKLVYEPVKYWADAKASLTRHENKAFGLHHETTGILTALLDNISGKTQPINVMIDTNSKKKRFQKIEIN